MAGIVHKITTVERIAVKGALVKDDLALLIDDSDEPIDITSFLNRFKGKLIDFTLSEKTEEEIEDSFEESFDD